MQRSFFRNLYDFTQCSKKWWELIYNDVVPWTDDVAVGPGSWLIVTSIEKTRRLKESSAALARCI